MIPRVVLLALLALVVSGCGASVTTQVIPIDVALPNFEEALYRLQDKDGAEIGRALLTIRAEGDTYRLTQEYWFSENEIDRSTVHVDRGGLRPRSSERSVDDAGRHYLTSARYESDRVVVAFSNDDNERSREAGISESSYDNLESLFLWRSIEMGAGERYSYINIVVDPKRGTISRALATVEVSGREDVKVPGGTIEAWRIDFTSAGVTNHAWYAVTPDRRLVKYVIARGPTLILDSVGP